MKDEDLKFFENLLGEENIDGGFGREYNLFCMKQGILIAESLKTKESIIEFNGKNWDEQQKLVPGLDDGHSGNTFVMSVRFAIAYLPQLLVKHRDERIDSVVN